MTKKLLSALAIMGVLVFAGCGSKEGQVQQKTEASKAETVQKEMCYVSLDVNPSIELVVEKGNQVVEAQAANEDAQAVLEMLELNGKSVEDAVEEILKSLKEHDYLDCKTPNEVLVSVEDNSITEEVLKSVNEGIQTMLETETLKVNLMEQKIAITEEDKKAAENYQISVGKYMFIQQLLTDEASVSMEDLASVSMKELVAYALQNDMDLTQILNVYGDAMEDAVEEQLEKADKDDAHVDEDDADDADADEGEADDMDDEETKDVAEDARDAEEEARDAEEEARDAEEEARDAEEEAEDKAEEEADKAEEEAEEAAEEAEEAAEEAEEAEETEEEAEEADDIDDEVEKTEEVEEADDAEEEAEETEEEAEEADGTDDEVEETEDDVDVEEDDEED